MKNIGEKEYKDYLYKKNSYVTLLHGSHRPLFISDSKKDEYKSMQRLSTAKTFVAVLAAVLIAVGVYIGFSVYIFPYFTRTAAEAQSTVAETSSQVESEESAFSQVTQVLDIKGYDSDTGLPIYDDSFNLQVINSDNPVDEEYSVILGQVLGVNIDIRIVEALNLMISDAKEDGITLMPVSGQVTYAQQELLYQAQVDKLVKEGSTVIMARAEAKKTVPYPGEADEQTGLCIKLRGGVNSFTNSTTYTWLNRNAANYGFTFRYPSDKESITDRATDYTVVRYVGKDNALSMRQLSMCLEEYIAYISAK